MEPLTDKEKEFSILWFSIIVDYKGVAQLRNMVFE